MKSYLSTLFFTYISISAGSCGLSNSIPNSVNVGHKTFYVENFFKASWYRASQFCKHHGMELASIKTAEEQDLLEVALNISNKYDGHWIGGNDLAQTQSYVWTSDGQDLSYTNWNPIQPDNYPRCEGNKLEHCMETFFYDEYEDWMWNDNCCDIESYFICEVYNEEN